MKYILRTLLLSIVLLIVTQENFAEEQHNVKTQNLKASAAGCSASGSFAFLDINNIRCRINTGGDMWWNLDRAEYYVPANTTKTSMFSASLWIGGVDVNGQLKLAAQRYRQGPTFNGGVDYWPGPISRIDASIDAQTCAEYDRLFEISRAEVDAFIAWSTSADPTEEFPDYSIPESIKNWPAHGDEALGQSYYLAPFKDVDYDGEYHAEAGDYPYYDVDNALCKTLTPTKDADYYYADDTDNWKYGILSDQVIKGDQTLWWVFNDKGNIHTETEGAAIGMEIRAQAFAFATNDEVNNMTFYSYEIINRSTFKLTQTYFSQWVDTDLGYAWDDFVGCDVARGLGYCYNGTAIDGSGEVEAYGEQPPAIGVDFFQGPYMDPDGNDNPKYQFVVNAAGDTVDAIQICDVSINGVNFGDGIVDNERFGMRRFVYHNNTSSNPNTTDPDKAPEYYNYLRGIWKDNTKMQYGGTAHTNDPKAVGPECNFMFPGDTDPCNWGTGGVPPEDGFNQNGNFWTEKTMLNQPGDRRFMQSAGPFDLEPGAVNYITVGIPWARATSGGPWASVLLLRVVDDKAQALFDNCFKVLDGPSAPDLTFLEDDGTITVSISNRKGSNNYLEAYSEIDPNIQLLEDTTGQRTQAQEDSLKTYRFEGYKIYQLRRADVSVESLSDPDLARLVAQFDKKNGITKLINYYFDQGIGANVPVVEVDGGDEGIRHTFQITEDAFADKDPKLVNHKQYYFIALAYSYNEYRPYSQEVGVEDGLYGQKLPFLAGRKNIKVYTTIPHKPVNGLQTNSVYGDRFEITRIQGNGNGGFELDLNESTVEEILSKPPISYTLDPITGNYFTTDTMDSENYPIAYELGYIKNFGPLNVKVVDPLDMKAGEFTLKFINVKQTSNSYTDSQGNVVVTDSLISTASWILTDASGTTWRSDTTINIRNEQVIPELGISIDIVQIAAPGSPNASNNGLINSSLTFADSSQFWFSGVPDFDIPANPLNWIRSGVYKDDANAQLNDWKMSDDQPWDAGQYYEKVIGGSWAPYGLVADKGEFPEAPAYSSQSRDIAKLKFFASIDVVLTSDKSKWTRCPVIETCPDDNLAQGGAEKMHLRVSPSIDKSGNFAESMALPDSDNPEDPNYISARGMGWFPGYVINVETGERLNVVYGENSWLSGDNGRDMQWNPSNRVFDNSGNPIFGGMHYLYILNQITINYVDKLFHIPLYDAGRYFRDSLVGVGTANGGLPDFFRLTGLYASVNWVNMPLMADSIWLPEGNDAKISIRVAKPYRRYYSSTAMDLNNAKNENDFFPVYKFNTAGFEAVKFSPTKNDSDLDLINVVPNPYYAYADGSGYERSQLDTRVKITNLPERCVVTIYNISGTLIRQYNVDKSGVNNPSSSTSGSDTDAKTSIDWDLKNFAGIPIAGGLYLIHVKETGGRSGERVIKWFGAMRPIDLNTF